MKATSIGCYVQNEYHHIFPYLPADHRSVARSESDPADPVVRNLRDKRSFFRIDDLLQGEGPARHQVDRVAERAIQFSLRELLLRFFISFVLLRVRRGNGGVVVRGSSGGYVGIVPSDAASVVNGGSIAPTDAAVPAAVVRVLIAPVLLRLDDSYEVRRRRRRQHQQRRQRRTNHRSGGRKTEHHRRLTIFWLPFRGNCTKSTSLDR